MSGDLSDISKGREVARSRATRRRLEQMAAANHGTTARTFYALLAQKCEGDISAMERMVTTPIHGTNMTLLQWLEDGNETYALELLRRNLPYEEDKS